MHYLLLHVRTLYPWHLKLHFTLNTLSAHISKNNRLAITPVTILEHTYLWICSKFLYMNWLLVPCKIYSKNIALRVHVTSYNKMTVHGFVSSFWIFVCCGKNIYRYISPQHNADEIQKQNEKRKKKGRGASKRGCVLVRLLHGACEWVYTRFVHTVGTLFVQWRRSLVLLVIFLSQT